MIGGGLLDSILEVGRYPRSESRANGARLPEVPDDLNCESAFGGFGASSHVNIVPLLNDIDIAFE